VHCARVQHSCPAPGPSMRPLSWNEAQQRSRTRRPKPQRPAWSGRSQPFRSLSIRASVAAGSRRSRWALEGSDVRTVIYSHLGLGVMLLLSSCVSKPHPRYQAEKEKITRGDFLLSSGDPQPGECYEILVYVVRSGDNLTSISRRFGCTVKYLKMVNPGLAESSPPLKVGQKLRVREFRREQ
jgi:hypothetical protein